jgi:hypothetical protein
MHDAVPPVSYLSFCYGAYLSAREFKLVHFMVIYVNIALLKFRNERGGGGERERERLFCIAL